MYKQLVIPLRMLFDLIKPYFLTARAFLFAFYYSYAVNLVYNKNVAAFRNDVFADIGLVTSSDKSGPIRIMEIGSGPGFNLDFFPKKCRMTALDKNRHFEKVLRQNLKKHPGIILENFVNERAENMVSIPSNSIDVVVSSNTHCSVNDSQSVLKEIKRVLVPGGRYYFFEHVLDEPGTIRFMCQKFFNKIGIWQLAFHGCTFVDFETEIFKSGLFKCKAKRYIMQCRSLSFFPTFMLATHYGGYGVKEK